MIELLIEDRIADLDQNIDISFEYQTTEAEKPTAVKNNFSKTIELKGTKTNNEIFGQIWKLDRAVVVGGDSKLGIHFNANKRVGYTLTNNGEIINSGYLCLDSITRKNNGIIYSITLYGGLGDFFYSLKTKEDGTERKLGDLYYGFNGLTEEKENTDNLMTLDRSTILNSWAQLNKNSIGNDAFSHITVVPAYGGYYEDFANNKQLINTQNLTNAEKAQFPTKSGYSSLDTDEGKFIVTETSRNVDEWEMGTLNLKFQRPAMRLKTLLNTIIDSVDGYSVNLDESITNSYLYKYGWVVGDRFNSDANKDDMVDKIKATPKGISFNIASRVTGTIPQPSHWFTASTDLPVDVSQLQQPNAKITTNIAFSTEIGGTNNKELLRYVNSNKNLLSNRWEIYFSRAGNFNKQVWNISGFVVAYEITYGNGNKKRQYQFVTTPCVYSTNQKGVGNNIIGRLTDTIEHGVFELNNMRSLISDKLGVDYITFVEKDFSKVNDITISKLEDLKKITYGATDIVFNLGEENTDEITDIKTYARFAKFKITKNNENDPYTNYNVEEDTLINKSFLVANDNNEVPYSKEFKDENIIGFYFATYNRESDSTIEFYDSWWSKDYDTIVLNKKLIFGVFDASVYDFLMSFTRMIGAMFIYNDTAKTIDIVPREKYYIDEVIDIDGKIDHSKDIKVIPTTAKKRYINIGLNTAETYANKLYKKKTNKDYGVKIFDTGYDFNSDTENLLDGNIFSLTQPFMFAPNAYMGKTEYQNNDIYTIPMVRDTTLKTTLFSTGSTIDDYETTEITTNADRSNITNGQRWPLMCYFGDDNEATEVGLNLVFFNGFQYVTNNYEIELYNNIRKMSEKVTNENTHIFDSLNGLNRFPVFSNYFSPIDTEDRGDDMTYLKDGGSGAKWINYDDECKLHFDNNVAYTSSANMYNSYWSDYLKDLYDKDATIVTAYVKLNMPDPKMALRQFYTFDNSLWVLNKIEDWSVKRDKTVKCTFIRVKDKRNYLGYNVIDEEDVI